uniref:IPT/TIG domain-containing protein n=2 Tax=Guillardia theta (strain CCMP2712) TaxID=905079 RepID=A0A0C3SGP2_GUITC
MTESLMTCRLAPHGRGNATIEASFNGRDWVEVAGRFEYRERCLITGVEPSLGLMGGITSVTLTGVGLKGLGKSRCRIGSSWGSRLLEVSDALVICGAPEGGWGSVMPPGDVGEADGGRVKGLTVGLMLEGASQEACEMKEAYFLYSPLRIDSVSPSSLVQGRQTVVTVVGQTFDEARRVGCKYSEAAGASLQSGASWDTQEGTVITSSMALCKSPQMSGKSEDLSLQVSYDGGQLSSSRLSIRYIPEPTITRLEPSAGSSAGGQVITVIGSNMRASRSGTYCLFGNRGQMPALHVTTSSMECVSARQSSPANVSFEVLFTGVETFTRSQVTFLYMNDSTPLLRPSTGPTRGGISISVYGILRLESTSLSVTCTFGDRRVSAILQTSSHNRLRPSSQRGGRQSGFHLREGSRELGSGDKGATLSNDQLSIEVHNEESIITLVPSQGPDRGGTVVRLYGAAEFDERTRIVFGLEECRIIDVQDQELSCLSPGHFLPGNASSARIKVTAYSLGIMIGSRTFEYQREAQVIDINPSSGDLRGGTWIQVIGAHFNMHTSLSCRFSAWGVSERVTYASQGRARWETSSSLQCSTPAWPKVGLVTVDISNNGVDYSVQSREFLYEQTPTVVNAIATRALTSKIGVASFLVHGLHFSKSRHLRCAGSTAAAEFLTSSALLCAIPLKQEGYTAIEVTNNGQDYSADGFVYDWSTADSDFEGGMMLTPSHWPSDGGTVVQVMNLRVESTQDDSVTCSFDGSDTPGTVVGTSQVKCVSPTLRKMPVDRLIGELGHRVLVEVRWESRNKTRVARSYYAYHTRLQVHGISPSCGPTTGSTQVAVTGSGFLEVASLTCRFGASVGDGSPSSGGLGSWREVPGKWRSSTLVGCSAPAASGEQTMQVQLSNNGVDFSSASATYTYERAPTVTSLSLLALDGSSGQVEQDHGRTVRVIGKHFVASPQLRCSLPGVARYISSSIVLCHISSISVKNVTVEIANDGVSFSDSSLFVSLTSAEPELCELVTLTPSKGSHFGQSFTSKILFMNVPM